ncbi:hypothetical protein M426DRAFT_25072 [Hypoxylon sp. CI-4A]|nr:hypothetical protein M426DRAFT_25072 [Hypoxylon sp. CI-4A]
MTTAICIHNCATAADAQPAVWKPFDIWILLSRSRFHARTRSPSSSHTESANSSGPFRSGSHTPYAACVLDSLGRQQQFTPTIWRFPNQQHLPAFYVNNTLFATVKMASSIDTNYFALLPARYTANRRWFDLARDFVLDARARHQVCDIPLWDLDQIYWNFQLMANRPSSRPVLPGDDSQVYLRSLLPRFYAAWTDMVFRRYWQDRRSSYIGGGHLLCDWIVTYVDPDTGATTYH